MVQFHLIINLFNWVWSTLGRSDKKLPSFQDSFSSVAGPNLVSTAAQGAWKPVCLSALITPHLVPVCSYTGLLLCRTQLAHGLPHHHHFHSNILFARHKNAHMLTQVLLEDTTTGHSAVAEFPPSCCQNQHTYKISCYSIVSIRFNEIKWNFNDPCGEAGLMQLHIIGHREDRLRCKQIAGAKKRASVSISSYNFNVIPASKR